MMMKELMTMTMTMRINKDDKYDDNDEPLCGGSSL